MDRSRDKDDDGRVLNQPSTSNHGDVIADEQPVSEESNPQTRLHGEPSHHFSPQEDVPRMHQDVYHELSGDNDNDSDLIIQFGDFLSHTIRNPRIGEGSLNAGGNEDGTSFRFVNSSGQLVYITIVEDIQTQGSRVSGHQHYNSSQSSQMDENNPEVSFNSPNRHTPLQNNAQFPMRRRCHHNPYEYGHPFTPVAARASSASRRNIMHNQLLYGMYNYYEVQDPSFMYNTWMADFRAAPHTYGPGITFASTAIATPTYLGLPYYTSVQPMVTRGMVVSESNVTQIAGGSSAPWTLYAFADHDLPMAPTYGAAIPYTTWRDAGSSSDPSASNEQTCWLCGRGLDSMPPRAWESGYPPRIVVLPCGHAFHRHCLRMA